MADEEFDRKYMPELLRTTFSISLGACFKSFEMMKNPPDTFSKMMTQMKELFTIPSEEGLQKKAEAMAGVWMDKGMSLVETCKTAGEQFTDPK